MFLFKVCSKYHLFEKIFILLRDIKVMKVLKEVLNEIKPDGGLEEVDLFLVKLNKLIKKSGIRAKAVVGGSISKDTFLKNDFDVDIFVKFDLKYSDDDLSKLLSKILKSLKVEKVHGSRDYYFYNDDFNYEIVPVLDIKKVGDAKNVTDMSPLHVKWVLKNSDAKLRDDIRLAKQFCKGIGVYGAESYIKGFSGHVLDILVIYYGGFLKLLKNSVKWVDKEIIDVNNYHKGKALVNMNKSKLVSPLIVVDPILPGRNAAAALGYGKFNIFKKKAGEFLKKKNKDFFVVKRFDVDSFDGFVLKINALKGKEDVVGGKILKVYNFIMWGLKEFKVSESGWNFEYIWFKVKKDRIPKEYERVGPPIRLKDDVFKFKKKHKKTYVKKGTVCVIIKRKYYIMGDMIEFLIKDKYVSERVKGIKCLKK